MFLLIVLLIAVIGCDEARDAQAPPHSAHAARMQLTGLDGHKADPFIAGAARVNVAIFVRTDCPIANRYAPLLRRIQQTYEPRGVAFFLVYPDAAESADVIRRHVTDYGHVMPAWRDPEHRLVALTGAKVTPEAAVFVSTQDRPLLELVYCGRIDDQFADLGKARPQATVNDLIDALEAVLAGQPVSQARTAAVGCLIQELP